MKYQFADRVSTLQPSAIREILKFTADPAVISFAAGNPAPEAFPVEEITRISAEIFEKTPIDALQYSISEGYAPLRSALREYMREKHQSFRPGEDEVIITSGAQQVMEMTTKAICNEGDVVLCEAPSFIGSLNAFRSFGVRLRGIPMEDDGIDLAQLEQALSEEKRAKLIYVIPNFQNPSGITMSLEKRRAVYELAKKYGVLILEDNPYGDTRFDGEPVPNIKSFDEDGIVVYAGTFSKVISSGMRVGYGVAPAQVCQKLVVCKQVSDVHSNIWAQMVAHRFLTGPSYEAHLAKIKEIYRKKSALMTDLLDRYMPAEFTYIRPQGGLFIWATLPDGIDMPEFCKRAVAEHRVAVVPGNAFLTDERETSRNIRLNYSTPTDEQIVRGVELLGRMFA